MKVEMRNINKSFGPVQVLKGIDLEVDSGDILALVGENGAGKSTLMKILTGIYFADEGEIFIDGEKVEINSIRDSEKHRISIVNQELNIFKDMTVLENLFVNKERTKYGIINEKEERAVADKIFKSLGIKMNLSQPAGELSIGMQQMLEIAKSLLNDANLIIMDEPTSALTDREVDNLFRIIELLKERGKSFIYISHRLEEIFRLCNKITILRDGKLIKSLDVKDATSELIVNSMVGYDLGSFFPDKPDVELGDTILEVKDLCKENKFNNISFELRGGEILGFAGLMGSGRTEVMNVLFGVDKKDSGYISIAGKEIENMSPRKAKKNGLGYVTENRREEGLFLDFSIEKNIMLNNFELVSKNSIINNKKLDKVVSQYWDRVNLRARDKSQLTVELSGGNQQKVVLAKWLANSPKILILDEPTRGIDVNSKKQIYELIYELKKLNIGVILVSSELVELLGVADRICVFNEGNLIETLDNHNLTEEEVMKFMMGGNI